MNGLKYDTTGFNIDGRDGYLVSGEFHYFRVPRADWRMRMELFRDAGGNCLATYVPWLIHEPSEGDMRFGDVDNRDIRAFLDTAKDVGLKVLLRPGPYQYSELVNAGIPSWLIKDYPEALARYIDGKPFREKSISYLHPVVLEKARRYYRAFADAVRPYMAENGGPVSMLQVDNELIGIHVWYGSLDYNRDTMGFGRADGRYPRWLEKKYGDISSLNGAYGTEYKSFIDAFPVERANPYDVQSCRRAKDYFEFYRSTIAEYAALLASWLREDGLNEPICHNSASPEMNCLFTETVDAMGKGFLLGSDHYYTLNQEWAQNSPTPQYAIRMLMSCDTLRAMDMPPIAFELPGGSPSDTPPILPEDLLACYMCNLAMGLKGVNYYVYTGGPNFPGTGETCDIYDYNAHVHADGTLNATYASLKAFGDFMSANGWLQRARRVASVQVGFEWDTLRAKGYAFEDAPFTETAAARLLQRGVLYTLLCSAYSPEMKLLTGELDIERTLIVPSPSVMSEAAQRAIIDFVQRGGQALILPVLPELDNDLKPMTLLRDFIGDAKFAYGAETGPAIEVDGFGRVFGTHCIATCDKLPTDAKAFAKDALNGHVLGFEKEIGKGRIFWLGVDWMTTTFDQPRMFENLLARMGAQPCVSSSNRNLFTALWQDEAGRRKLFVMNLYSGAQSTEITVYDGEKKSALAVSLKAMEVRAIDIGE